MKELTIEQKARAYDEAKARMSKAYNSNRCTIGFMNEIFPELIESDELIREEIINYFECQSRDEPCRKSIHDKWIAWIEKQGQTFTKKDVDDAYLAGVRDTKQELEKQGDHSIYNVPSREIILAIWDLGNEWKELTNGCISTEHGTQLDYIQKHWQESEYYLRAKQSKYKPADKVKPKFKVGDWVVENGVNGNPVQITSFEEDKSVGIKVWFSNGTGTYVDFLKGYHKWTIEDAKDGDILITVNDKRPFIYKGCLDSNHPGLPVAYCGIDSEGYFTPSSVGKSNSWWSDEKVLPATKAQRDNFYIKMKEAGYKWDAEKKELKKISQRMISAEAKEAMYGKPAWSEEDDAIRNDLINYFRGSALETPEKEVINFLKSLKDRVGCEASCVTTKEWSEEDRKRIQRISDFIWKNRKGDTDDIYQQEQDVKWLKSLRPQEQLKPSEEQMEALKEACDEHWEPDGLDHLYTLYQDLKKLSEE